MGRRVYHIEVDEVLLAEALSALRFLADDDHLEQSLNMVHRLVGESRHA